MRILYITPFFQHPTSQDPTRHYYFIRELSRRHAITLLTPTRSPVTPEAMEEMTGYTERILLFETKNHAKPTSTGKMGALSRLGYRLRQARRTRQTLRNMKGSFLQLIEEKSFDLILFHGKSVFSVIKDWEGLPIVVDFCDASSTRIIARMRHARMTELPWLTLGYLRIRQIEKKIVRKTPYLAFITERDRDAILGSRSKAVVIPNIVDLQYWARSGDKQPKENCIMYSGAMDYRPNADGALYLIRNILPIVRQYISGLRVFIVGRDPLPELEEEVKQHADVTVTGSVADMRPYFERAMVYAAPLRIASGMQNKLLEAMAMGVPIVTTPIAAAGVSIGGREPPLVVADTETRFAQCVVRLLSDAHERLRLVDEGRQYMEDHFVLSRTAATLEKMCMDALENTATRAREPASQRH